MLVHYTRQLLAIPTCIFFSMWSLSFGEDRKPNVVFIVADDLGYRELGCFGQKLIQTHNLDRMARQGMRLTQHYSGNAVCAPSRCVLMTGKHPGHAYIRSNKRHVRFSTASSLATVDSNQSALATGKPFAGT